MADSLRDELLAIPGIDGADFDGGVVAPEGVRVRLSAGADPIRVGEDVRKVLAEHGLRSQMTSPPVAPEAPTQLEPPVARVLPPDVQTPVVAMPHVEAPPETVIGADDGPEPAAEPTDVDVAESAAAPDPEPAAPAAGPLGLRSVAVEEARDGLTVVATRTDGVAVQRPARDSAKGLDAAVVAAAAELTDDAARPRLVGVFDAEAEGVAVVTVVVEVDDGSLRSGSAVVAGGRAFALARATWRALSAPV